MPSNSMNTDDHIFAHHPYISDESIDAVGNWIYLPTYEVRETDITVAWFLTYAKRYWHVHCERSKQSPAT